MKQHNTPSIEQQVTRIGEYAKVKEDYPVTMLQGILAYPDGYQTRVFLRSTDSSARQFMDRGIRSQTPDKTGFIVLVGSEEGDAKVHPVTAAYAMPAGSDRYVRFGKQGANQDPRYARMTYVWYADTNDRGSCRFELNTDPVNGMPNPDGQTLVQESNSGERLEARLEHVVRPHIPTQIAAIDRDNQLQRELTAMLPVMAEHVGEVALQHELELTAR